MTDKDTGGPAFPVPGLHRDSYNNGMTLRDYFAAKAMNALLTKQGPYGEAYGDDRPSAYSEDAQTVDELAEYAYAQADAMLIARNE